MTKKKIERISVIHREKILWLKWYFLRDKKYPKFSVLERKIHDAASNQDMLAYQKYTTIKRMTDIMIQTSDKPILDTVKEVYVYHHINVIGACQRILYLGQTAAYLRLNTWFETYSDLYFSLVPISDMSLYFEMANT